MERETMFSVPRLQTHSDSSFCQVAPKKVELTKSRFSQITGALLLTAGGLVKASLHFAQGWYKSRRVVAFMGTCNGSILASVALIVPLSYANKTKLRCQVLSRLFGTLFTMKTTEIYLDTEAYTLALTHDYNKYVYEMAPFFTGAVIAFTPEILDLLSCISTREEDNKEANEQKVKV